MKKLPLFNTILLLGIITYLVVTSLSISNSKEVYIVTGELYQNFDYQKELNEEYLAIKESKDKKIENLISLLQGLEMKIKSENNSEQELYDYQVGIKRLQVLQHEVEVELGNLNAEYNIKIWDKLNNYVTEFGKENGYSIIFGAGGEGNIMYAKDVLNVTLEVTDYCNQKYNGK